MNKARRAGEHKGNREFVTAHLLGPVIVDDPVGAPFGTVLLYAYHNL